MSGRPALEPLTPGTRIAERYLVAQRLGGGGCGDVYAAIDRRFGAPVAVKIVVNDGPETRERFQREARLGNRLGNAHPALVRCHDWGEVDAERLYLVMDLVDGARPLDLLNGPREERLRRLVAAARIVADAHALGIVHRDLKPGNFLVDARGRLFLSDFGLSKDVRAAAAEAPLTRAGTSLGTPAFMAPEQFESVLTVDERADVHALGVMLFMALSGRFPFAGGAVQVMAHHVRVLRGEQAPPRVEDVARDVSPALAALCARSLAPDPAVRTPSAAEFADELSAAIDAAGELAAAGPAPTPRPPTPRLGVDLLSEVPGSGPPAAPRTLSWDEVIELEGAAATVRPRAAESPPPRPSSGAFTVVDARTGASAKASFVGPLASGARGFVWLAEREDGRALAVKVPLPHARGALDLEVEARIVEQLQHPNIVEFQGRGPDGALCFERAFSNPLVLLNEAGARVRLFRDPGTCYYPLPPGLALELGSELLAGLEYLHGNGFVHCDVKLGNFLVVIEGEPRLSSAAGADEVLVAAAAGRARGVLVDLGAARSVDWLHDLARGDASELVPPQLTPMFAPPEALCPAEGRGPLLGPMTDIYAAGLLIYTLLTGRMPYDHLPGGVEAARDVTRVAELKLAERSLEARPISRDAVERAPLYDVRLLGPDQRLGRTRFVEDAWRFLSRLTDCDGAARPSAAEARAELHRVFRFELQDGRPRQRTFSMSPRTNRLVDAACRAAPEGRITVARRRARGGTT